MDVGTSKASLHTKKDVYADRLGHKYKIPNNLPSSTAESSLTTRAVYETAPQLQDTDLVQPRPVLSLS